MPSTLFYMGVLNQGDLLARPMEERPSGSFTQTEVSILSNGILQTAPG